jgi:hypothetical protein
MFGTLICKFRGHRRGKRVGERVAGNLTTVVAIQYACPRCGAQWERKVRVKTP